MHMSSIASRDLRNHTAEVLRQVAEGNPVTITVHGVPVAEISPVSTVRRPFIGKAELAAILTEKQSDAGLRDQLAALAGETTDDLDPLT